MISMMEMAETRIGKPAAMAPSSAARPSDESRSASKRYQRMAWVSART
jgi:hypothetical protein